MNSFLERKAEITSESSCNEADGLKRVEKDSPVNYWGSLDLGNQHAPPRLGPDGSPLPPPPNHRSAWYR